MFHFLQSLDADGWMHLITLLGGSVWATKLLRVLVQTRDSLKDLGQKEPPTGPSGLFATVGALKKKVDKHETWLVQMRAKLSFDRLPPDSQT